MTPNTPLTFQPLTGLYEPSAIQQLPDGRFLVVEDEKDHSFSLATLSASGDASSKSLGPAWFHGGEPIWKLDDLEGLALDGAGYLYAVTSHSRDDDGDEQKGREKLARFRIEKDKMVEPVLVSGSTRRTAFPPSNCPESPPVWLMIPVSMIWPWLSVLAPRLVRTSGPATRLLKTNTRPDSVTWRVVSEVPAPVGVGDAGGAGALTRMIAGSDITAETVGDLPVRYA